MKSLNSYLTENDGTVKNKKFLTLMKKAGLEKVLLCKGDGYFYITSDDDETYEEINSVMDQSIYVNSFSHQSPEQWVEDIKNLLKGTKLVREGLLSGPENTIQAGDKFINKLQEEIDQIKNLSMKNWTKYMPLASNAIQFHFICPTLLKYIGIEDNRAIGIVFNIDWDGEKIWNVTFTLKADTFKRRLISTHFKQWIQINEYLDNPEKIYTRERDVIEDGVKLVNKFADPEVLKEMMKKNKYYIK